MNRVTIVALSDELEKIAAATAVKKEEPKKSGGFKTWAKNTAIIGAGAGLGHGAGMLVDKGLEKAYGDKWAKWSTSTKKKIIGPALGAATAGAFLANQWREKKKEEAKK